MAKRIEDFAVFGGQPAFPEPLHVGRPNLGMREAFFERVNDIWDRRWLTNNGFYVQELEKKIAEMTEVKHCIAMCNGTVGLEIAIRALGMKDEVIVPSFTFVATPHALQWQEITPVFCDVAEGDVTLDPAHVEKLITPRTTGIVGVHLWGHPCDVDALEEIAERHGLRLLFDAAHAFGCSCKGRPIGGFGDAEVFSFHATKFVNTLEGGAVLTNCDELAERIRFMKNFGFRGRDEVAYIGTNGKMSEVSAAMGLTSFEQIDTFVDVNRRNMEAYAAHLAGIDGVELIRYRSDEVSNCQYAVIRVDAGQAGLSRDRLVEVLAGENVDARRYFYPGCHRMEAYRDRPPHAGLRLPRTEKLAEEVIALPTGTAVSTADIEVICDLIRTALLNSDRF